MAEGRCASISRYLLIILNLIFWIVGVVLLSAGIWLIASDAATQTVTEKLHLNLSEDLLDAIGYSIFGIGICMFLIGFCGCCGAIRESGVMLGVYILFMAVLLCGEVGGIIYVALERTSIETKLRQQLLTDVTNYTNTNPMSNLDFLQAKFSCCGSENYTDYYVNEQFITDKNATVPASCCKTLDKIIPALPVDWYQCQHEAETGATDASHLHTRGCFNILLDLVDNNSSILIGISSGIIVIEALGILLAIFLCRHRSDFDYYDD